ncbi:hypothetical protein GUJ93_ZPchr0005g14971 [Zizania palustris]|uniref:Uncharacterized protein n=1 Tax=Zizania palustris TaxID=103762 RepID=A0A8J5T9R3_ZIZPA|nr:hypothetical protein GUJ93_ZPchr0005g14971 [Zizania palustris]
MSMAHENIEQGADVIPDAPCAEIISLAIPRAAQTPTSPAIGHVPAPQFHPSDTADDLDGLVSYGHTDDIMRDAPHVDMEAQTPEGTKPTEESELSRDTKIPTAAATASSDTKLTTVDVAATACTRKADDKNSGAGKAKRLCLCCQMEMSESESEMAVLDNAPNKDETTDSSEIYQHRPPKFFQFI